MNTDGSRIALSIAQTPREVSDALAFCGSVYQQSYGTHWTAPPDVFLVARDEGRIVATGGLTFAARHERIASESYFQLTNDMRRFMAANRVRIVEFGRFASVKALAAKAIFCNALSYAAVAGMDFVFAWANPSVSNYTRDRLGLNFWPIAIGLDLDCALNDARWASRPTGFFQRKDPPVLHMAVIPFWENVIAKLAEECSAVEMISARETELPKHVRAAIRPTSFVHAAPRLVRAERANGGAGRGIAPVGPRHETPRRQRRVKHQ